MEETTTLTFLINNQKTQEKKQGKQNTTEKRSPFLCQFFGTRPPAVSNVDDFAAMPTGISRMPKMLEISRGFSFPSPRRMRLDFVSPKKAVLGCPKKLGSMARINGLFHLLINGVYIYTLRSQTLEKCRVQIETSGLG